MARAFIKHFITSTGYLILLVSMTGCAIFYSPAVSRMADNLSYAFENQRDVEMVENATPAYLLMMDALIKDNPGNASLLKTAAGLNATYADMFVKDPDRVKLLTGKALNMALDAACFQNRRLCDLRKKTYEDFKDIIDKSDKRDIDSLYTLGSTWASWIQANSKDWNAVAEIARVETIMHQVVLIDPNHQDGGAFLYLGALATLFPPALGGQPEKGRQYFEKAIEISGGKNLYAKYLYAQKYARLVFDQQLHDRLLNEVCNADPDIEGYTLINTIAQRKAKILLDSSDDYF